MASTSTREAIVLALKRRGEARAEELAAACGVTVSAMRQHLTSLAADGLVSHREVRSGPGRPKHVYSLTPAAESRFPKTYDELTNELLDYVSDESPELLERVFERRRERRVAGALDRLAAAGSLGARVAELARILDEDGYLAEVVEVGEPGVVGVGGGVGGGVRGGVPAGLGRVGEAGDAGEGDAGEAGHVGGRRGVRAKAGEPAWRIVEHNCAILGVAERYGQACTSELDFIRTVLPDAHVERVAHMMAGARHCAYEIRPR